MEVFIWDLWREGICNSWLVGNICLLVLDSYSNIRIFSLVINWNLPFSWCRVPGNLVRQDPRFEKSNEKNWIYIRFLCKSYTSAQNRNANFKNTLYFLQLCVSSMRRIFCLYLSCPNKGCSWPYSPLLFINMANVRAVVVIKWKLINWELYSFNGSMDCHHNDQLWFLH